MCLKLWGYTHLSQYEDKISLALFPVRSFVEIEKHLSNLSVIPSTEQPC